MASATFGRIARISGSGIAMSTSISFPNAEMNAS